ncbi:WhiB family transcriptional regulator [Kitasatospora sp. NPDC093806]|uniref:WhiB family transcriptional regulator n=1 Tax=Kitasatospora sp. NPDC093806 TaxID=3155075 RepID=UPI003411FFD2
MARTRTLLRHATRTPHRAGRPAATVLAEYRPNPDSDLRGAACNGADTDLFYPEVDEDAEDIEAARATAEWAERRAKMICAGCPVKSMCLADALERKEPAGIFGGLNERERNSLLRRAARSRARVNIGAAG